MLRRCWLRFSAAAVMQSATPATPVHPVDASAVGLLAAQGITITPLAPLGAAVRGLDLRSRPSDAVLRALESAMATRGFLVFKDQGVLTGDEQVHASKLWGARQMHSTHGVHPQAPNEHIFRLANDRSVGILGVGPQWHNDGSFCRDVFSHVGYHIVRVAEGGGGTIFAHQGAAFDALPAVEQERWSRLVSINSTSGVLHPLAHTHPISGRTSVYLHLGMTGAILEVTPKADDPKSPEKIRLLEEDEMRHLFQTYNALLNAGFSEGRADLVGAAPRYGTRVEVCGLQSKPELNGKAGVVDGVLDRTNGRVAVHLEGADRQRVAVKPANLLVLEDGDRAGPSTPAGAESAACDASGAGADAYTAVYEYEPGDCIFIDNLAVAHRATPEAHLPAREVGLRVLHRTTVKAPRNFDPPFGLPPVVDMNWRNPFGKGVWQGGGLGFRWDETIPMQN